MASTKRREWTSVVVSFPISKGNMYVLIFLLEKLHRKKQTAMAFQRGFSRFWRLRHIALQGLNCTKIKSPGIRSSYTRSRSPMDSSEPLAIYKTPGVFHASTRRYCCSTADDQKDSIRPTPATTKEPTKSSATPNPVSEVKGVQFGGAKLMMVFTCKKCDTRAAKVFTKKAYEHGVVLVRCDGCDGLHLIADNLGWFGEEKNIEEILMKKGEAISRIQVHDGIMEIDDSGAPKS